MKILTDNNYKTLITKQIKEQILFMLKYSYEFMVVVNKDGVTFNPKLPPEIEENFGDFIPFAIAGYTFKSAFIQDNLFIFEAGFGPENIGAMVYVDIDRILQVVIKETPVFINITATLPKITQKDPMEVFKSKERNKKFFKKD